MSPEFSRTTSLALETVNKGVQVMAIPLAFHRRV
jgi:hypothetical protein